MTTGRIGRRELLGGSLLLGAATAVPGLHVAAADLKGEISVAYSATYVFGVDAQAVEWWNSIKQQFEAKYPGATLKLLPMDGTDVDMMTKLALAFRSASTTPDVIQLPTSYVGQFASSNYLLPLDNYIKSDAPFWNSFPPNMQAEGRVDNQLYALVCGENNSGILYNIEMLKKAGISTPWTPKNWTDILDAARKVKAADPGVVPLWAAAGVATGATGILQGCGAMIYGSSTPTMFDAARQKWIVDSPGLREVFDFYRTVYSEGLGASTSDLFSPKAVGLPPAMMRDKRLAIALGSNWYGFTWTRVHGSRYWPTAKDEAAPAPIPTSKGQPPGVCGTLGGWSYAVARTTKLPNLTWGLMKILEDTKNSIGMAVGGGFTPPSQEAAASAEFVNYAPPFTAAFAEYIVTAKPLPYNGDFPVYARGLGQATGELVQHPTTSVSDVVHILHDTVANQLGDASVEVMSG
ncbi:MAG TPA: extracellular solute-binding protein [Acetobacteraceae bacterium]